MTRIYNFSMAAGLTLVTGGTAMYSMRLALIVCGAMVIGLTLLTVQVLKGIR